MDQADRGRRWDYSGFLQFIKPPQKPIVTVADIPVLLFIVTTVTI
jgi:hypothetical protein